MAHFYNLKVTKEFLDDNPQAIFVFGDNLQRQGHGGAAALRDHKQSLGFITKKAPNADAESFFRPDDYSKLFFDQLRQLEQLIEKEKDKTFYISPLGSNLANRHHIWERIIKHNLIDAFLLSPNVVFCWEEENLSLLSVLSGENLQTPPEKDAEPSKEKSLGSINESNPHPHI